MYESINVWKRIDENTLIRYRCFRSIKKNKYFVQSVDYYHHPFDAKQAAFLEKNFIELLLEDSPETRSKAYDSLEEAITKYR